MDFELSMADKRILEKLSVDIISEDRNYWLVRTQGGDYFEEFYFNDYIGIEWDNIVDTNAKTIDELQKLVSDGYPNEKRPTYIANQIFKFMYEFKKGDIVLIPNKDSKIIAFGEIADNEIYVSDDGITGVRGHDFLDFDDEETPKIPILRKRRKVAWIKHVVREHLDPYLQAFVYAHSTIVDLKNYALFIDRTLSDFYIKGKEGFFTFMVNKATNIPMDDLAELFMYNREVCDFTKKYLPPAYKVERSDLICKIDVQSKGPQQLVGPAKKVLAFGFACILIFGGDFHLKIIGGQELDINTPGLIGAIKILAELKNEATNNSDNQLSDDYSNVLNRYNTCQKRLELSIPGDNNYEIIINADDLNNENRP